MVEFSVNGTLVESYINCKRQAWFHIHRIKPFQDHPLLEIGRLVDEDAYERDFKRVNLDSIQIDIVRREHEELVIGEVKKSSAAKESARLQLLFYMYTLNKLGLGCRGLLMFPKEKRKEWVILDDDAIHRVELLISDLEELAKSRNPPELEKKAICKNCAYLEWCFS